MKIPKLIIFDLSDVLIKGLEGCETVLATELGLPLEKVSKDLFSYNFHDFYIGKINEEACLSHITKKYRWNISVGKFKKIIRNNFREIVGTRKIIKVINEKYPTILLSVNPPEWSSYFLNNFNLDGLFSQGIFFSHQIGFTKRQVKSFRFILRKLKVKPEDALLIDDSRRNLGVATSVGIPGIRFTNPKQLLKELQSNNIL